METIDEEVKVTQRITIPYRPRDHFRPLHDSTKRFKFVVAHRRAGKSVSQINEIIKRALENNREYPPPRYAYIGPSFAQTKDLIWGYAKHYTMPLRGLGQFKVNEGDLQIILPNGAMVNLYGGAGAYERMRGLYFDGAVMDEYALLNPTAFPTVVRPCLADYRGWCIVSGTSNGDDHFHERKIKAEADPESWDVFILPVTDTDALHPDEVIEMTKDMSPEQYAREMLCSFEAPIEGAYYADILNEMKLQNRFTRVPYDPATGVITWWDLGIDDATAIWYLQRVGRALHVIRYEEFTGKGFDKIVASMKLHGYNFSAHVLPHDIKARELGTGRSRFEVLSALLDADIYVCPSHRVEDGITAVRSVLPMCYFDEENTQQGVSTLRNYQRGNSGKPLHNWASHGADSFRTGAVAIDQVVGYLSSSNVTSISGKLSRRIRGMV